MPHMAILEPVLWMHLYLDFYMLILGLISALLKLQSLLDSLP